MRAVDTNVLVRLATRGDARQVAAAEEFVAKGAWVSSVVLVEAIWVLGAVYDLGPKQLAIAVEMFLQHRDLTRRFSRLEVSTSTFVTVLPRPTELRSSWMCDRGHTSAGFLRIPRRIVLRVAFWCFPRLHFQAKRRADKERSLVKTISPLHRFASTPRILVGLLACSAGLFSAGLSRAEQRSVPAMPNACAETACMAVRASAELACSEAMENADGCEIALEELRKCFDRCSTGP